MVGAPGNNYRGALAACEEEKAKLDDDVATADKDETLGRPPEF